MTDVAGLNRISRRVLGNAAHALAGIVTHAVPDAQDRPAVGLTMFGVTTPCVTAVVERLGDQVDPLVFHATGTGGPRHGEARRRRARRLGGGRDRPPRSADLVAGGIMAAGDDRLDAIVRTGVPYVGSVGATRHGQLRRTGHRARSATSAACSTSTTRRSPSCAPRRTSAWRSASSWPARSRR